MAEESTPETVCQDDALELMKKRPILLKPFQWNVHYESCNNCWWSRLLASDQIAGELVIEPFELLKKGICRLLAKEHRKTNCENSIKGEHKNNIDLISDPLISDECEIKRGNCRKCHPIRNYMVQSLSSTMILEAYVLSQLIALSNWHKFV